MPGSLEIPGPYGPALALSPPFCQPRSVCHTPGTGACSARQGGKHPPLPTLIIPGWVTSSCAFGTLLRQNLCWLGQNLFGCLEPVGAI